MSLARVRRELDRRGLLLAADATLPSVTSLVAGEPVRGSWWSHPKAHAIFGVLEALDDEPSALAVKLVDKKVTLVHRALWGPLFAVATASESWQTKGLSRGARALLRTIEAGDTLTLTSGQSKISRELEDRLLVHGRQHHTDTGAHVKVLETWGRCATRKKFRPRPMDPALARAALEERLADWPGGKLPWQRGRPPRGSRLEK